MRALCGAIITAGALIGLGLTAIAYGIRFENFGVNDTHDAHPNMGIMFGTPTLTVIVVILGLAVIIGLGIAFLGLMFHHERRYHELQHGKFGGAGSMGGGSSTTTPLGSSSMGGGPMAGAPSHGYSSPGA